MTNPTVTRLEIKRGDSLALDCQALADDGVTPIDITGWTLRSQIRNARDGLLAELSVTLTTPAEGRYSLTAALGATATWSPGSAEMDIEYEDPAGLVQSTETVPVLILRDVTRVVTP